MKIETDHTKIIANIRGKIPGYVEEVAAGLERHGYEAYLVGGSVRDLLLGKMPQDYDIATNAHPEQISAAFPKSIPTGAQFGTIRVLIPDEAGQYNEVEVTTYRSEEDYYGGRWPTKVEFAKKIEDDLARRDFTVNSIALRLDGHLDEADIVDPFAGIADLGKRTIKAVGDARERFTEDGLRPLRACRLAANLGFEIETETFEAISHALKIVDNISAERVRDELVKLLNKSPKPSIGIELMRKSGILEIIIPELLEGEDVTQPQYHVDDVYTHTLKAIDNAEPHIRLAALFHDIAKPRTKSVDETGVHFYGHDMKGGEMTREIMKRLKFSKAEIERTTTLVRWHMFYYPNSDWRKANTALEAPSGKSHVKLVIIRHAATTESEVGIVSGQQDPELNANGKKQAEELAEKLAAKLNDGKLNNQEKLTIYSSDLSRARQTAEIIASKIETAQISKDTRLRERDFGELTGLDWAEFQKKFPDLAGHPVNSEQRQEYLPGGETISGVESRVKVATMSILKKHLGETVLIVTHSGVIRILRRLLLEASIEQSIQDLESAGFLEVDYDLAQIDPQFLTDHELELLRQEQIENEKVPGGWTDAAVRRFIKNVGGEDLIDDLMKLRIADALANEKNSFNPQELQVLAERIAKVRAEDMALKVTDLDIGGKELLELGFKGKEIGKILNRLLDEVIEDPVKNDPETLLKIAAEFKAGVAQR